MIFVRDIKQAVAEHYGTPLALMDDRCAKHDFAHPRQMAMALAVKLTRHSKVRIGYLFGGRDHTTVLYACRQTKKRCRKDTETRRVYREVAASLMRKRGRS